MNESIIGRCTPDFKPVESHTNLYPKGFSESGIPLGKYNMTLTN